MKESPERYTNPFLSDEENAKVNLLTQEVDHSNTEDDKLVNSLTPPEFYKDICVDEGTPQVHADLTVNEPINDQDLQNSTLDCKACGADKEVIEFIVSKELISKAVDDNGPEVSLQPGEEQDLPLPSLKSLLETVDQQPQSPVDKTKSSGAPELQDAGSDNVPMVNRGTGELSFSAAGPTSGLVAYSGHIGFSGSTSIRSDSSTTSTRSFAFPILQNEWNSSPVRMAKVDRGRLQKRCGWRHGLLCFRF